MRGIVLLLQFLIAALGIAGCAIIVFEALQ